MLKDTLDKVKAAEKSADDFILDARKKADELIKSAESDAEAAKTNAADKAEYEYRSRIAKAEESANAKNEKDAAADEKEMAQLRASMSGKKEVIDQIIDKILN